MTQKKKLPPDNSQSDFGEELIEKINHLGFGESTSVNLSDLLKQLEIPEDNQENQSKNRAPRGRPSLPKNLCISQKARRQRRMSPHFHRPLLHTYHTKAVVCALYPLRISLTLGLSPRS